MWNKENSIREFKKLAKPPDVSGGSLYSLGSMISKGAKAAGRKLAEMARFLTSEWLREKNNPALDQLSTLICPKKNYKTNRKDLDGSGLLSNVYGWNYAPWSGPPRKRGKGIDIHKVIGKLPKPKSGWTLPGHKYTGPYNPLRLQLRFDPETGEKVEFYVKPTGKTDAIAAQHDVDYSLCDGKKNPRNAKTKRIGKWSKH